MLQRCTRELRLLNVSVAASLLEGLEETLTLQRLGVPELLRVSFRTTNVVESVSAPAGGRPADGTDGRQPETPRERLSLRSHLIFN